MTGLIRKDMYCLRKNLKQFFMVTLGVIVIAVLFIVSTERGNIAKGIELMQAEGMTEAEFFSFFRVAVWATLFIPMAFLSMIVECFKEDKRAGFYKQLLTLPLTDTQIVGSRYASLLGFALVGMTGSLLAAFFISFAADYFLFAELAGYIFTFGSILLIYMSIVMFLLYLFGSDKADIIQCAPFVGVMAVVMGMMYRKMSSLGEEELDAYMVSTMEKISDFMAHKWWILVIIAAAAMVLSFIGACESFKRRRGDI